VRSTKFSFAPLIVGCLGLLVWGLAGTPAAAQPCPAEVLFDPDGFFKDAFGSALAADGAWLLIGSGGDDTACPFDPICTSGSAYFFRRQPDGTYLHWQKVVPEDIARVDNFGRSVAIEGRTAAVGSPGDDSVRTDAGAVFIYELRDGHWELTQEILPPDPGFPATIGGRIAMEGDLLVSASQDVTDDGASWSHPGVYVFRNLAGVWTHEATITHPEGRELEPWVDRMALDGGTLVVSNFRDETLGPDAGIAWVFERVNGAWTMVQRLGAASSDVPFYGRDVDIDAGRIAVSAPSDSAVVRANGVVDIFERGDDGRWRRAHQLRHADPRENDGMGRHIRLRGDRLVASVPLRGGPATADDGALAVFDFAGGAWRQSLLAQGGPFIAWTDSVHVELRADGGTAFVSHEQFSPTPDLERVGSVFVYDLACLACPADLDADGQLTIFDFLMFQNLFDAGDPIADFDGDGELTIFDFLAFQTAFDAGCE